ncbi:zinc-dependent alcohol dehydrogenase [Salibacterium sp. K-3]
MKAGIFKDKESVRVIDKEIPAPGSNEALIKVAFAGICGTDMMIYAGLHPRAETGLIMGHEFSGRVEKIGSSSSVEKGARVAVNPLISCGYCYACVRGQNHICANLQYIGIDTDGGFADYVNVPEENLHPLEKGVSDDEAALIEPLAVAVHSIRKSQLRFGDVVLVLGAGPIGILIAMLSQKAGASKVIISDVSDFRLRAAEKLGFRTVNAETTDVVNETKDNTEGVGADVVFEAAGNQSTADQTIEAIKPQGEILVISVYKMPPQINLAKMHFREISLKTTRCFSNDDFKKAVLLLKNKEINVQEIISHKIPLSNFKEGFELMKNTNESLKVLFQN